METLAVGGQDLNIESTDSVTFLPKNREKARSAGFLHASCSSADPHALAAAQLAAWKLLVLCDGHCTSSAVFRLCCVDHSLQYVVVILSLPVIV